MPNVSVRRRRLAAGERLAAIRRHQQRAQPAEAVRGHQAEGATSSPSASSTCGRNRPVASTSSSKNEAPWSQAVEHGVGAGRSVARYRPGRPARSRTRSAGAAATAMGVVAQWRGDPVAAVAASRASAAPRRCVPPGTHRPAMPARSRRCGRQHFGLPRAGGRLEAFEQGDGGGHRIRPFQPRVVGQPLPVEQEAQEVTRGDRLDLSAQAANGVVVDAGEQTPVAPFVGVAAGGEAAAQDEALASSASSAAPISSGSSPSGAASAPGVTGPSPSSRPRRSPSGLLRESIGSGGGGGRCRGSGAEYMDTPFASPATAPGTAPAAPPRPTASACGVSQQGHAVVARQRLPASRPIPARSALPRRSGSRATAARRAILPHWPGQARPRCAPARSPPASRRPSSRRSPGPASAAP